MNVRVTREERKRRRTKKRETLSKSHDSTPAWRSPSWLNGKFSSCNLLTNTSHSSHPRTWQDSNRRCRDSKTKSSSSSFFVVLFSSLSNVKRYKCKEFFLLLIGFDCFLLCFLLCLKYSILKDSIWGFLRVIDKFSIDEATSKNSKTFQRTLQISK